MVSYVRSVKWLLSAAMLVAALLVLTILVHEAGHSITAEVVAGLDSRMYIWPGYELYPDFGSRYRSAWPNTPAFVTVLQTSDAAYMLRLHYYENYILFMGSGLTQLVSLLSLCVMTLVRPKGILLWLLVSGSVLHYDMFTYTVFPLFDLKHLIFWGGSVSEPLLALGRFGVPQYVAVPAIIGLSLLQFFWLYRLLRKRHQHTDQSKIAGDTSSNQK
jgi:hypothetical protein